MHEEEEEKEEGGRGLLASQPDWSSSLWASKDFLGLVGQIMFSTTLDYRR